MPKYGRVLQVQYRDNPYPEYDWHYADKAGVFDVHSESFCQDIEHLKYDEETTALSLAVNDFYKKVRESEEWKPSLSRCAYKEPRVMNDRLGFLAPDGTYVTARSDVYSRVLSDIYNTVGRECNFWEPKLLVAPNKVYTRVVNIIEDPAYKIDDRDLPYLQEFGMMNANYMLEALETAEADKIPATAKKTTSMGYPYKTVDGHDIATEDITFGPGVEENQLLAGRRNWLQPKKGWFESEQGSFGILTKQLSGDTRITPDNIVEKAFYQYLVSFVALNFRTNCPDAPEIEGEYHGQVVSGKNRRYSRAYVRGSEQGIWDAKSFNSHLYHRMLQELAANRIRYIYSGNTIMQWNGIILGRAFTQKLEHGCNGFLSIKTESKKKFHTLVDLKQRNGYKFHIWRQDRSNSEVSICTNFAKYMALYPVFMHDYLKQCATTVVPCVDGMRVQQNAFTSGVWYTTLGNFLVGFYTALSTFCLAYTSGKMQKAELLKNFGLVIDALWQGKHTVELTFGVILCPFMVTDDVAWPFLHKEGHEPDMQWMKDYDARTQLNTELLTEVTAFGVHMDEYELTVAPSSILSKLLFSEHPGFIPKDGMSIQARLNLLAPDMRDVVNFVLKKHFKIGVEGYQRFPPMFWQAMADTGLDIHDIYNEFSPVEQMIMQSLNPSTTDPYLGKFVSMTPLTESATVDPKAIERVLNAFKIKARTSQSGGFNEYRSTRIPA